MLSTSLNVINIKSNWENFVIKSKVKCCDMKDDKKKYDKKEKFVKIKDCIFSQFKELSKNKIFELLNVLVQSFSKNIKLDIIKISLIIYQLALEKPGKDVFCVNFRKINLEVCVFLFTPQERPDILHLFFTKHLDESLLNLDK